MKNYTVSFNPEKITLSFKHISIVVLDPTENDVKYIKDLVQKTDRFKYVYKAIVTNPNLKITK